MKNLFFKFAIIFLMLVLTGCGYNKFQSLDEDAKASWSEVLNQYQRRADLVPNLVATVKGYAEHEEKVFAEVADARSKVGSMQVTPEVLNDPDAFAKYQAAQGQLTQALSHLMAVSENYPNLKADQGFRDLQAQLEGTENRVTVARNRYIETIKDYNVAIRSFPQNLTAMMFGYKTKPSFTVDNEKAISTAPAVNFGDKK
jgi:LemA protein